MKKLFTVLSAAALCAACLTFTACGAAGYDGRYDGTVPPASATGPAAADGSYDYNSVIESDFQTVAENPSSYFSLDRNTAAYSLVRYHLEHNLSIPGDSVRIEEMINYFNYDFPSPQEKAVEVSGYLSDCPWNANNKLLLTGIKTSEYKLTDTNANYVFLIDVSGSMRGDARLGLAQYGLNKLVDELGDGDLLSIVTYASGVNTVLDGGKCSDDNRENIKNAISSLNAYGSTNGEGGLQLAYEIAQKHFIDGGNNRIIIISDGDFNVGMSSQNELKEFIREKAESGVYLSVLGVGMGNMRDSILETLATCGNGNYAYLDNETEAEKVMVEELGGLLKTVAKDAKASVTFTERVEKYRLIGYDTKIMSSEDFDDEKADAGELGSNLCVAALYEITLAENADGKLADIEVRYKDVRGQQFSDSVICGITVDTPSSQDLSFISCVAEFGLILRQSKYKGDSSLLSVTERLNELTEYINADVYKSEFVTLVGKAFEKRKI